MSMPAKRSFAAVLPEVPSTMLAMCSATAVQICECDWLTVEQFSTVVPDTLSEKTMQSVDGCVETATSMKLLMYAWPHEQLLVCVASFQTCDAKRRHSLYVLRHAMVASAQSRKANVQSGVFGADMQISLLNDGPVTFILRA